MWKKRIAAVFVVAVAVMPGVSQAQLPPIPRPGLDIMIGPIDDAKSFIYGVMTEECRRSHAPWCFGD